MELKQIESLLESYELGHTSLQEEAQLKTYFKTSEVPIHLEHYRAMFQYFSTVEQQTFEAKIPLKHSSKRFKTWSIAAAVVLFLGLFMNWSNLLNMDTTSYSDQELQTYNQAKTALEFLSINLNKGTTSQMNALSAVSNAIQKGQENFILLNNFNTTTNKIFNINP